MNDKPYFPPLKGNVDCCQCDIQEGCSCFDRHQRDRRDFTYTSGRCPRLPNLAGFVDDKFKELYAKSFPLVHAEHGDDDSLDLSLILPGEKRMRKVYQTKSGYWYYQSKDDDGYQRRKVFEIQGFYDKDMVLSYMKSVYADYCLFRCTLLDYYA